MFKNLDKTSVIGIIACIALMIVMFVRMGRQNAQAEAGLRNQPDIKALPTEKEPAAVVESGGAKGETTQGAGNASSGVAGVVSPASVDPLLPDGDGAWAKSAAAPYELKRDGEVVFRIDPSSGVVSSELLSYSKQPVKGEEKSPVVLGHYDYPFLSLGAIQGRPSWQALDSNSLVQGDDGSQKVVASRLSADGRMRIVETWSLDKEDRYEIAYTVTFSNVSDVPVVVDNVAVEVGALSPGMAGDGEEGFGGVAYMLPPASKNHCEEFNGSKLKSFAEARAKMRNPNLTKADREEAQSDLDIIHDVSWACVHTRYFMQCVRAKDPDFVFASLDAFSCEGISGQGEKDPFGRFRARLALPVKTLNAGEAWEVRLSGFAGPKDLNLLDAKGQGMEGTLGVDRFLFGTPAWMGSLSKFFLNSLLGLSRLFPGKMALGFGLILLTIIVKLLLWPLSYKSSRSMKKMQELQPQLKELREKYKSDPQEMYRRQQELFKANHVSQFGGCLPMLVQIPIFFALFNTFRGSIELRQACFLWASDLSMPDTVLDLGFVGLNPMALIMVGTMIWQQAITPSGEPSQKRMMMFMSVAFTYFLYTQPSGLTLYMTVNQLLSMLQFAIIKRLDAREAARQKQMTEA